MNQNNFFYKVWRVIYPLILYFLMDVIIVWLVETLVLAFVPQYAEGSASTIVNIPSTATIVFLIVSIIVNYQLYKKDYNGWTVWIYKKPQYFLLLLLIGALASHGLSALISLMNIDSIIGSYTQIEDSVFSANAVFVILQTVILAPISEELLFRGLIYKRISLYMENFWGPALISSALFGLYHFNLAQGVFAFLFGLLACASYDKIHNLWVPMTLHIGGNLLSVIMVYTGFTYTQTWIYITVMILCLVIAFLLYHFLIRPTKKYT